METVYSKQRLRAYVAAYVGHSTVLKKAKFTREAIGKAVFGDISSAKQRMSECTNNNPLPPLTAELLHLILDAVQRLFVSQLEAIGSADPLAAAHHFEQELSRELKLGDGQPIRVEHFRIRTERAAADDLGVPDIYAWDGDSYDFLKSLLFRQSQSRQAMKDVLSRIRRTSDPLERFDWLRVAISIGMLNHPGSRWHNMISDLLLQAACEAQLQYYALGRGVSDELKRTALRLTDAIHFCRTLPTLDSPTNYQAYALRGEAVPVHVWRDAQQDLWHSILAADAAFQMDRENPDAVRARSSAISMLARIQSATGGAGAIREADQLNQEAARDIERLGMAYGFTYPILRCLLKGQYRAAIKACEQTLAQCEQSGDADSAAAFAALCLQITQLSGQGASNDSRLRELARKAIESNRVRYKCSHVFDAVATRKILEPVSAPAKTSVTRQRPNSRRHR